MEHPVIYVIGVFLILCLVALKAIYTEDSRGGVLVEYGTCFIIVIVATMVGLWAFT